MIAVEGSGTAVTENITSGVEENVDAKVNVELGGYGVKALPKASHVPR